MSENPLLHRDLLDNGPPDGATRGGKRLEHAEGTSTPLRPKVREPQPRGARIRGNRPVDQSEAADRFIAAPEHEKMHDERLWDLRQKRDRESHGIPEWEELRNLASAIKEHTLTHLDAYLDQFETNARANGVKCIGRATPASTIKSCSTFSKATARSGSSRASRC